MEAVDLVVTSSLGGELLFFSRLELLVVISGWFYVLLNDNNSNSYKAEKDREKLVQYEIEKREKRKKEKKEGKKKFGAPKTSGTKNEAGMPM